MKPSKSKLRQLYETKQLSTHKIAKLLDTSHTQVLRWLASYGIDRRPIGRGLLHRGIAEPSPEELYDMIHLQHMGYEGVAAIYGVDQSAIRHWLIKHGIPRPTTRETRYGDNLPTLPERDELLALSESGQSIRSIAVACGVTPKVIRRLYSENGIQPNADGWNGGHRFTCNDGHLVRSTYEQRVDNWLDDHGIQHTYEPALPCDRRYHADFLARGWYIEIWGVRHNPTYLDRKQRKRRMYAAHNMPLIELETHHFDTAHKNQWARILSTHLVT